MDVFELRNSLIADYEGFVRSYLRVRDPRLAARVEGELGDGALWPDPLLQLNPAFEPGPTVDDLVDDGTLHPTCGSIFRRDKSASSAGRALRLHRHQAEAIHAARRGESYVLTTGTGSGKSLAYIVPIVDAVLRAGPGRGVKAIVVYPMNALANSQLGELEKFLQTGLPPNARVPTYARYTGLENREQRDAIVADPPDIILTNYVMLELILTRPYERPLIDAAKGLQFLVLDELHTYRGRQGADVAFLLRRLRTILGRETQQFVGTSATLAGGGSWASQQREVSTLASLLFGSDVQPANVIGETLRRSTASGSDPEANRGLLVPRLAAGTPPPDAVAAFLADPLAAWIETKFGLEVEPGGARLRRARPQSVAMAVGDLAASTGAAPELCRTAIEATLLRGAALTHPDTGAPVFAFRLHQFLGKGDTLYASLDPPGNRFATTAAQQFVPGDRSRALFPLAFCRECGQEYYVVRAQGRDGSPVTFVPRPLSDRFEDENGKPGFLYVSTDDPWPTLPTDAIDRLPPDWLEDGPGGEIRVVRHRRSKAPRTLAVDGLGGEVGTSGLPAAFIPAPFAFCLCCGITYGAHQKSDFAKLALLSSEGRSSATTVLALTAVRHLGKAGAEPKLLSFTDNRQDASLQAGHLNDFVEVALLRGAILRAVEAAGPNGLDGDEIPQRVFAALALDFAIYAANPEVKFETRKSTERVMRDVMTYRVLRDLRRGWRITAPNLEQCDLLEIDYSSLVELCADVASWRDAHPALATATPETRRQVCRVLLDHLRRELAIKSIYLDPSTQERIRSQSFQLLREPWALDEGERLDASAYAVLGQRQESERQFGLSPRGLIGQYLRHRASLGPPGAIGVADSLTILGQLLAKLTGAGILAVEEVDRDVKGYQIVEGVMRWTAGPGARVRYDPLRVRATANSSAPPNPFFVRLYRQVAREVGSVRAREHTAQVPREEREKRESQFRSGALPILFCSPTMELGIDIASLSAVNMRNVPPAPSNYAQRSGRAGRSGQPALIFTYCASTSPHDSYFFKRQELMVAGQVKPPRLDLANEDLVRAHVHAIWLAEVGKGLGSSLRDVLDVSQAQSELALLPEIVEAFSRPEPRIAALAKARKLLAREQDLLARSSWWSATWLDEVLAHALENLDRACDRWRSMYRAAVAEHDRQGQLARDPMRSRADRDRADRLQREARSRYELLLDTSDNSQSDFYTYRYLASEGFLPGYSFPRLPVSAFIPARKSAGQDEYLSRPRFLAISEFGPRSIVYHEGSKYAINRVILPVDREEITTSGAKRCGTCGYFHPRSADADASVCDLCGGRLDGVYTNLFRMQSVSTVRRERIGSDEEERRRLGYELETAFRFGEVKGQRAAEAAQVKSGDEEAATLTYGPAATLWRINLGWSRRANRAQRGFVLDLERGYWARNEALADEDPEDPMSNRTERVIPYVEDRRNLLVFAAADPLDPTRAASLLAALKRAIQARFELEDNELGAELLPNADEPERLLLFEAAEGGAGVLRRLVEEPDALPAVAREALSLCHFDPETGADLGDPGPDRSERCEAACYDCLMSYTNQRAHRLLDRMAIRDDLLRLTRATVAAAPGLVAPADHQRRLFEGTGSQLERDFLRLLVDHGLRLPTRGQVFFEAGPTSADFVYDQDAVLVFIDGPPHDFPNQREADTAIQRALEDEGWTVVRIHHTDDWRVRIAAYPWVFGPLAPVKPPPTGKSAFDPDLFPVAWIPLLERLVAAGVEVAPGRDLSASGHVIGSTIASLARGDRRVHLLDARRATPAALTAARADGATAVSLDPTHPTAERESAASARGSGLKLVIDRSFLTSAGALTGEEARQAVRFLDKLAENPATPGLSLERVGDDSRSRLWSARVNKDLRAILGKDGDTTYVLHVDHHDDAYRWAETRSLEQLGPGDAVHVVSLPSTAAGGAEAPAPIQRDLFAAFSDRYLVSLGVPADLLPVVRLATSDDKLLRLVSALPEELADRLLALAAGEPVVPPTVAPKATPASHVLAMGELAALLEQPIEAWTRFLHPAQRALAEGDFKGPVKVTGAAGTGKTVVALHRARYLAAQGKRILLATYVRTLCRNLERSLSLLASPEERERITVDTVDGQAFALLRKRQPGLQLATDQDVIEALRKRAQRTAIAPAFVVEEWQRVIAAQGLVTWPEYRDAARTGREKPLAVADRKALWQLVADTLESLATTNRHPSHVIACLAAQLLQSGEAESPHDAVLIDETQDLSPAALRFIGALAAGNPGGLMLVGDGGQRIYARGCSLLALGIDTRGRSRRLKLNYRTTAEISRVAERILAGERDDLDGGAETGGTISLLGGPQPAFVACADQPAELAALLDRLRARFAAGLAPREVAVFVRDNDTTRTLHSALHAADIPAVILDKDTEIRAQDAVHIGTMHRAKGLEFKAVFIADASDDNLPSRKALRRATSDRDRADALALERQLLYVSLTRARDQVTVLWHGKPSRFLEPLLDADGVAATSTGSA